MSVGVVIVAAGRGVRMGGAVPKQFQPLAGGTMLQQSVAAFDRHPRIDEIVVVLPADALSEGRALVGDTARAVRLVAGGDRRQDSVRHGVGALPPGVDMILVHDAARPFVDADVIDRVVSRLETDDAVVPAVPARDTVKRVRAGTGHVIETIPRDEIWLAQTPQGFRRPVLEAAMALGAGDLVATDDVFLAERLGHPVAVVPGSERNVKVTTPDDLAAVPRTAATSLRAGTGYDLHRLVEGRPLMLAGVHVPFERGPLGHSDGDVICHALVDAMLGAAGAGDIGRHFPNSDARWKDAAGIDLLRRTVEIVGERGWVVANCDVTVVLERPKIAPFIDGIRASIAATLGVPSTDVSVKGKTNEGVDAVGRGDAIQSHAVVLLARRTA